MDEYSAQPLTQKFPSPQITTTMDLEAAKNVKKQADV